MFCLPSKTFAPTLPSRRDWKTARLIYTPGFLPFALRNSSLTILKQSNLSAWLVTRLIPFARKINLRISDPDRSVANSTHSQSRLDNVSFALQSPTMENNWASENLQTIRTLMERSAIYRRALAPIMSVTGSIGLIASVISRFAVIETNFAFTIFWMATSVVALVTAMLFVRRQALQESEPFWSLPTQRVWGALLPNFF